jgi:hypothetical protein
VTLDIDSSTPIRSLARYRELVIAVHEAPASEQETNSVEWKGEADLAEKRWQAQMGRQILGMANRDPEVADNMLGGCGYIVVGVSPGELLGTQVHDTAKIESWIRPVCRPAAERSGVGADLRRNTRQAGPSVDRRATALWASSLALPQRLLARPSQAWRGPKAGAARGCGVCAPQGQHTRGICG